MVCKYQFKIHGGLVNYRVPLDWPWITNKYIFSLSLSFQDQDKESWDSMFDVPPAPLTEVREKKNFISWIEIKLISFYWRDMFVDVVNWLIMSNLHKTLSVQNKTVFISIKCHICMLNKGCCNSRPLSFGLGLQKRCK